MVSACVSVKHRKLSGDTGRECTCCLRVSVCLRVSGEVERGHPESVRRASSLNAPDLGGGAEGELAVMDGSSDLGYRSGAEIH